MGPYYLTAIVALLGPIVRVAGFASTRTLERTIEIGPRTGERFTATTPTHTTAAMQLASGVTANLDRELRGARAVHLRPRDPRQRGRAARCPTRTTSAARCASSAAAAAGRTSRTPRAAPPTRAAIGLHDMVEAIAAGQPHRASGPLGAHIVEVARGILRAADEGASSRSSRGSPSRSRFR